MRYVLCLIATREADPDSSSQLFSILPLRGVAGFTHRASYYIFDELWGNVHLSPVPEGDLHQYYDKEHQHHTKTKAKERDAASISRRPDHRDTFTTIFITDCISGTSIWNLECSYKFQLHLLSMFQRDTNTARSILKWWQKVRVIFYGPKDKLCETHCIHIQEDFMVVSPIHQLVQSSNVAVVTVCVCV